MRIYKKVIMYAVTEVPDNLTTEQVEELESDFETSISLDLESMQEGGSSNYLYEFGIYNDYENPDGDYELSELIRRLEGVDSVLGR